MTVAMVIGDGDIIAAARHIVGKYCVMGTACEARPPSPLAAAELCSGTVVSLSVVLSKQSTRFY